MEWIRAHPYAYALCAAGVLLVGGIFIVQKQGSATVSDKAGAWDGANLGVLNPTSYGPTENTGTSKEVNIMQQVQNSAPYTYIPPAVVGDSEGGGGSGSFDLNSFIAMLGQGSTPQVDPTQDASAPDAYSLIPTGLMSTTTAQNSRTTTQQTLYDFGNDIGSYIQSFEEQHPTMSFTLKDHAEDRNDPQKAAAVGRVAQELKGVGQSLLSIETVPSGIAPAHTALAKSYVAVGTNLALLAEAKDDADFLHAIEVYNASADTFVKNYVAIATLFGAYGVVFSPTDAGSVFTFTPASL
ncbi:MAG: hypothetical protein AAB804_03280 [Patescibacteria group bacterium]